MSTLAESIAGLPPLRETIARFGLGARKALGQNFLLDANLTAKIARQARDLPGCEVVEIGPGPGGLTRALLAQGARRVVAVERDSRCLAALHELQAVAGERLVLIEGDALALDLAALARPPRALIANLPYNIATPLILGRLAEIGAWAELCVMVQREVAERLAAAPGTRAYGRLSVMAGWLGPAARLFDLPPAAFTPPPRVTSSLVRLTPRPPAAGDPSIAMVERVTRAAFGQRRKMLRQSLKSLGGDPEPLIAAAGLDPRARAETVPVAGYLALARALATREARTGSKG